MSKCLWQLLKMRICENKCICNGVHVNRISPIVGRAVNGILMEGQGPGQRRQKTCQIQEKLKKKSGECCGYGTFFSFGAESQKSLLRLNFYTLKLFHLWNYCLLKGLAERCCWCLEFAGKITMWVSETSALQTQQDLTNPNFSGTKRLEKRWCSLPVANINSQLTIKKENIQFFTPSYVWCSAVL